MTTQNPFQSQMMHPLIGAEQVTGKTTDELQETISKLTKQLSFASRTNNYAMSNQILMALNNYRAEYSRRMEEQWAAESNKSEEKINIQMFRNT